LQTFRARVKHVFSEQDNRNDPQLSFAGIITEDATSLLDDAEEDALKGKMCCIDLNDPHYFSLHTKQLREMIVIKHY